MKIIVLERGNEFVYQLHNISNYSDDELNQMFYSKNEEGIFERIYPSAIMFNHDKNILENNYNLYLRNINTDRNIKNTLEWICTIHKENDINWWLVGSAALYVRGLDIKPRDIDVMTYKTEIHKIEKCIYQYISEPFHHVEKWVVKGFGVIYKDVKIDYAFEPEEWVDNDGYVDFGVFAENHLEKIIWNGHEIMVPPIELHIKSNERRERFEIVKKIKEAYNI